MILQLLDLIPVTTPLGKGYAIILEASPNDNYWTVALNDNGALVTFTQDRIRIDRSYTYRRMVSDEEMQRIIERKDAQDQNA